MKVLVAVPIYERHKAHLDRIAEDLTLLYGPKDWELEIEFFVNNSSVGFFKDVLNSCARFTTPICAHDLGEIYEEREMTLEYGDKETKDYMTRCRDNKGYIMAHVRNKIIERAEVLESDWILFIDCDSVFDPDSLVKLLELEKWLEEDLYTSEKVGVISGLPVKAATRFTMPDETKYFTPSIYFRPENNPEGKTREMLYEKIRNKELSWFSCDGVGFAFALVSKNIFSKFKFDPEKSSTIAAQDGTYFSEDYAYCLQLRDAGYQIFVAVRVEIEYAEIPEESK